MGWIPAATQRSVAHWNGAREGVGVLSAADVGGHGGYTIPPHVLFRNLSATATRPSLCSIDTGSKRGGAQNKLRVGNFLTFSGSPGIWGPASTNSVLLAVSEINKRGGILGREIELSMYDAGGPIEEVVQRAAEAIAFDEVDILMTSAASDLQGLVEERGRFGKPPLHPRDGRLA